MTTAVNIRVCGECVCVCVCVVIMVNMDVCGMCGVCEVFVMSKCVVSQYVVSVYVW